MFHKVVPLDYSTELLANYIFFKCSKQVGHKHFLKSKMYGCLWLKKIGKKAI